jgi:hypothetical protein
MAALHAAELQELLPGILNQMGPDSLMHLKKMMAQVRACVHAGAPCRLLCMLHVPFAHALFHVLLCKQLGAGGGLGAGFPGAGAAGDDDGESGGRRIGDCLPEGCLL